MTYISAFLTAISNGGIQVKSSKDIRESATWRRTASATDRGAKRSISYWLKIEHEYAYGFASDWKSGLSVKFKSTMPGLQRADLRRIRAEIAAQEAADKVRQEERYAKIALRAAEIVKAAARSGTTPYLDLKKVGLLSALRLGQDVIVPIFDDKELVSWQRIKPDGTKRFPFGGRKKGCYHLIGQIDPRKPIILCEGWATGASLSRHGAVIVAFDAGNLLPVAKAIRRRYSNAPIIVAADNDANQVGQKAAQSVVGAVANCSVQIPLETGTDFNDFPDQFRSPAAEPVGGASGELSAPSSSHAADGDWNSQCSVDAKNRIVPFSFKNSFLYLLHHENFKGLFVYDKFMQATMIRKCPPWEDAAKFKARKINDHDLNMIVASLEDHGLIITPDKANRAIDSAARSAAINSAQDYFNQLTWDGVERLDTFLKVFLNCIEPIDPETGEILNYLPWVGKKWMTAAINRVFDPGCEFHHMLILESPEQGLYKSSALKALATFGGECYHTDSVSPLSSDDKYTALFMTGKLIIELAEMTGFSQKDDEALKKWITQTTDRVKLPHDKFVTDYPRSFVLAASTNKMIYLKDPTGNRRYWPVTVGSAIDIKKIEADREQLWAEAVHWHREGLYLGPTPEENNIADIVRGDRLDHDVWTDEVLNKITQYNLSEFKTIDILDKMGLRPTEKTNIQMTASLKF